MQAFLRTVIAIVSLLSATSLVAQNVGISARIEPGEIQIGEQALIRLKIRTNDLDNTFLIVPPDTALHRAEALAFRVVDTVHLTESLKELSAEMVVTSFDSTLVALPAFGVRVGNEEVYTKEPLYLKVNLPEVDMEHPEEFFWTKRRLGTGLHTPRYMDIGTPVGVSSGRVALSIHLILTLSLLPRTPCSTQRTVRSQR